MKNGVVRLGLAGLGKAGRAMVSPIGRHPGIALAAVADIHRESVDEFAQAFSVSGYTSVEEMCRSGDVDAVYIATPTQFHTEHAALAAAHGKHIIVEKPMAITLADADAMIGAAAREGVHLIVTHSHGGAPSSRAMREIVRSGELGRVRMIHNWYFTDWLYRPRMKEELDSALGGGVTLRQGAHQFDTIRLIGGGLVRSVRAVTGRWDKDRPTEGAHVAFLEFDDGTAATAVYSGYDHFHSTELTFGIGEGGKPVDLGDYAAARRELRAAAGDETGFKRRRASQEPGGRAGEQHQPFFGLTIVTCEKGDIRQSPDGLYVYGEEERREVLLPKDRTGRDSALDELYEAAVHGRAPLHSAAWGRATLEVCLAVLESARLRKEIFLAHQVPAVE